MTEPAKEAKPHLTVRLPKDLLASLRESAKRNFRTVTQEIERIFRQTADKEKWPH